METPGIVQLSDDVIKRIAAGEVIQQPANVVKELIENCIDAGTEFINVQLENGGYSLISVSDNGSGIREKDLPVVCRRHTTSKIKDYSDLANISTFGFRGEALFSMSCCSHLSIITKTHDSETGFIANYLDGELLDKILPSHAIDGTIINVKDLFYNNTIRLKSKSKTNTEVKKIEDIIRKYAIVYPYISFTLISNHKELFKTYGNSTFEDVTRKIYNIEEEGMFFNISFKVGANVKVEALLSHPGNSKAPKSSATFINGRLVSSQKIKRGIESVYLDVVAKGLHGFFFIIINLPPQDFDVNIHPSKKEVRFLNETEIIKAICEKVKEELQKRSNVRGIEMIPMSQKKINLQKLPKNQTLILDYQKINTINEKDQIFEGNNTNENLESTEQINQNNIINQREESFINNEFHKPNDFIFEEKAKNGITPKTYNQEIKKTSIFENRKNDTIEKNIIPNGNDKTPRETFSYEENNKNSIIEEDIIPNNNNQTPRETFSYEEQNKNSKTEDIIPKTNFQSAPPSPRKEISTKNMRIKKKTCFEDLKYEPLKPKPTTIDPHLQTLEQVLTGSAKVIVPKSFRKVQLQSICNLKEKVISNEDCELKKILKHSSFCGFIGLQAILLQKESSLYIVSLYALLKDFFYQRILELFANFPQYRIQSAISINDALSTITSNDSLGPMIESKSPLLLDYFSISVHGSTLYSLPIIINGYQPTFSTIPLFLYQLATKVNWEEEEECFDGIIDALSSLFSVIPEDGVSSEIEKRLQHEILTIIYPEIKKNEYKPSIKLSQSFQEITIPFHI